MPKRSQSSVMVYRPCLCRATKSTRSVTGSVFLQGMPHEEHASDRLSPMCPVHSVTYLTGSYLPACCQASVACVPGARVGGDGGLAASAEGGGGVWDPGV